MMHCKPIRLILLTAIVIFTTVAAYPQCLSQTSAGDSFRLVFPDSVGSPFTAQLVIMSDNIATVDVTTPPSCCPDWPCVETVFVAPNEPAPISINAVCAMHTGNGRAFNGISVDGVHGDSLHVVFKRGAEARHSDDAYLALPSHNMGRIYYPLCYQGNVATARWTATAIEPDTVIMYYDCDGTGPYPSPPLEPGMTFQHHCDSPEMDCTGQPIASSMPFSLVSGSYASFVPPSTGTADTLMEMMLPVDMNVGGELTEYPIIEFNKLNQSVPPGDIIRILAAGNAAEIYIMSTGIVTPDDSSGRPCPTGPFFLLNAGDWCDVSIADGATIYAYGAPVQIGQYMKGRMSTGTGDPSMMQVIPANRYPCHHRFYSFAGFDYDADTLDGSYVAIVAPYYALGNVQLDGMPLFEGCIGYQPQILPGLYSWTQCRVEPGVEHVVDGNNIGIMVYSYGQRQSGAYSYPAGIGFND